MARFSNPERNPSKQITHDGEVCRVGKTLCNEGYSVAIDGDCGVREELDLPLFGNYPSECGNEEYRRPDVYAKKGGRSLIVEVETDDSIDSVRTRCQLSTFSRNGSTIVFVPRGTKDRMNRALREWGVTGVEVREF